MFAIICLICVILIIIIIHYGKDNAVTSIAVVILTAIISFSIFLMFATSGVETPSFLTNNNVCYCR